MSLLLARYLFHCISKTTSHQLRRNATTLSIQKCFTPVGVYPSSCSSHQRWNYHRKKSMQIPSSLISRVTTDDEAVSVTWTDGRTSKYHHIWLRDHCRCSVCYNNVTNQKEFNIVNVPLDIRPVDVSIDGKNALSLKWPDGHNTIFNSDWLKQFSYDKSQASKEFEQEELFLWDRRKIESNKPKPFNFVKIVADDSEVLKLCQTIVRFGFAFVHETPPNLQAIDEVAAKLGGFTMETHYGRSWAFSNEALEHADSAYMADYLRGHTDNTYFSQPAGLQMLQCVAHEGSGGLNLLVDGFHAAEKLRHEDMESYQVLTSTTFPFHYKDTELHLKAQGPVIKLDPFKGNTLQIRFNTYDMEPLSCFKYEEVPRLYKALNAYANITCDPESQLWFKLSPGELLIMANWRVLHGRSAFTGRRLMQGCYVDRDYFFGKYHAKVQ